MNHSVHDEDWAANPIEAFSKFVRTPDFIKMGRRLPAIKKNTAENAPFELAPIRTSSIAVYTAMFGKFVRWMGERGLELRNISQLDILAFLNSKTGDQTALNSRIRIKYLRLLEKVFRRLKVDPNPASLAAVDTFQSKKHGKDEPSQYLNEDEVEAFMSALPQGRAWRQVRDRAMLATMLGAGIQPAELLGLDLRNIGIKDEDKVFKEGVMPQSIPIQVSAPSVEGSSRWHQTQLRSFAVPMLVEWIKLIRDREFSFNLLFPGNQSGKKLDKSALYRTVRKTFMQSGIDIDAKLGGRTLRNTFAVMELNKGTEVEVVKEFLGLHEVRSMDLYIGLSKLAPTSD